MPTLSRKERRKAVLATLAEVLDGIQHLETPVYHKMAAVLKQAQAELEKDLKKWIRKQGATQRFTTQRYRNALIAIRRSMQTIRRIEPAALDGFRIGAQNAGVMATAHLEKELVRFADIFEGTIQPVSVDQAAIVAKGDRVLIRRFKSSAKRYAGEVRKTMIRELAVSRARGETIFELTGRLERNVPSRFMKMRHWAHRLARTETMNAYNVFHHEGIEELHDDDPTIGMRWDASFDHRRCPICASLDGAFVPFGKDFTAKWTAKDRAGKLRAHKQTMEKPPAHPNCRCVLTPWRDGWEDMPRPTTPTRPDSPTKATRRTALKKGAETRTQE